MAMFVKVRWPSEAVVFENLLICDDFGEPSYVLSRKPQHDDTTDPSSPASESTGRGLTGESASWRIPVAKSAKPLHSEPSISNRRREISVLFR